MSSPSRRTTGLLVLLSALLWAAPVEGAPAQAPLVPSTSAARLQGHFSMHGRITSARGIRGEHVGKHVTRSWSFQSGCPAGQCATVTLIRSRAKGTDMLVLSRRSAGYYKGTGIFFAPLRCGMKVYKRGERVPFTISLRITAATVSGGSVIASHIKASYTNRSRTNLTRCVVPASHDAATYKGTLVGS